jgi:hypothetical protein
LLTVNTARLEVVLSLVVDVRVVQHGLGGDASNVQAGATKGATLLNAGSLQIVERRVVVWVSGAGIGYRGPALDLQGDVHVAQIRTILAKRQLKNDPVAIP